MEGGALLTEEFKKFSQNYVMFLHVTTQIEGRKHDGLLGKYGRVAFPTFLFLDDSGSAIARHRAPRTADEFAKTAQKADEFLELKARAEAGDKDAKVKYTLARAQMGQFKRAELEAEIKKLGRLGDEDAKAFKGILAGLMMDETSATALGEAFAKMEKDGYVPTEEQKRISFYYNIWRCAEFKGDVAQMEHALGKLRKIAETNARLGNFVRSAEAKLAEVKGKSK